MAYDGKLLARARTRLEQQRSDNQAEQQRRLSQVYLRVPEIQNIDLRMRAGMAELVRLTVSKRPDIARRLQELRQENLDLQVRRAELLVENGFGLDYLDEIFSCKKCGDTGMYGGAPCQCLERLYNQELTKELGALLRNGNESFESFDLSLYPQRMESGVNAREVMERVLGICRRYAESFPGANRNLLMQGAPGLGKTYLSACIARVVSKKGYSVCYDTAASALEAFEVHKFSRDADAAQAAGLRVQRMLDCDLMILDDLGTEISTPASTSALYTLINSRLINGKHTIMSTNLPNAELARRYTPQISSRILGEFHTVPFVGNDIRLIKKGV